MQTKYLCVLIHIWIKDEVGALFNQFKPSSEIFYWPFQGGTSFVDLLCFSSVSCLLCICARLFNCALRSPAGKGLTSWLSFVVSNWVCHFPIGILGQVWYLIESVPDLCTLTSFAKGYNAVMPVRFEPSAPLRSRSQSLTRRSYPYFETFLVIQNMIINYCAEYEHPRQKWKRDSP